MIDDHDAEAVNEVPRATGFRRFMQILAGDTLNIVKVNLVFLLACLPVVTLPGAVYALHHIMRKMVWDRGVSSWTDFWRAFKAHWKEAYGSFFLVAVTLVMASVGAWFYLMKARDNPILFAPFLVCSTILPVTFLASSYLYGLLDMGLSLREAVKKALLLGVARPLRAALAALCFYGLTAAGILALPISGMYVLFIGFTLPNLLGNFYIRTVLSLLENNKEESK